MSGTFYRKIRAGDICTIAGNGEYSGDGGPAVKAGLSTDPPRPAGLWTPMQNRVICAAGVYSSSATCAESVISRRLWRQGRLKQ